MTAPSVAVGPTFDLETRLTEKHHQSLKLWLRMLSCTVRIEDEVRVRLRNQFGVTSPRFDLMAQLERHSEGLRMGELSKRLMVTSGNITGITDQLEKEKMVERVPDPDDRRAYRVRLTAEGKRTFTGMAALHEAWIAELFSSISPTDKNKLIQLLSKINRRLYRCQTDIDPAIARNVDKTATK